MKLNIADKLPAIKIILLSNGYEISISFILLANLIGSSHESAINCQNISPINNLIRYWPNEISLNRENLTLRKTAALTRAISGSNNQKMLKNVLLNLTLRSLISNSNEECISLWILHHPYF